MNEEKNVIENLRSEIENKSINPDKLSDDSGNIYCDKDHDKDSKIREGNKFYMVIIGNKNDWEFKGVKCLNCNIKDIFNSVKGEKDGYIAVVESRIRKTNINSDEKEFFDYNVWELTEISNSVNS